MKKGAQETTYPSIDKFFDAIGRIGYAFIIPAIFAVFGNLEAALFLEKLLGSLGSPATLLLVFLATLLLRTLFGTIHRALPILFGIAAGLIMFSTAFDFPFMGNIKEFLIRFPVFSNPAPPFFAGLTAIICGSLFARSERGRSWPKILITLTISAVMLFSLSIVNPFPEVDHSLLSVDAAIDRIAKELGQEYRDPKVEEAVRKVLENQDATEKEKNRLIRELTERLKRSEEEKQSLEKAIMDTQYLEKELAESRRLIEDLKKSLDKDIPLLVGRDYNKAVQPNDPVIRDFSVEIASKYPGPYDEPQSSQIPSDFGLRQIVLIHGAISSEWKYVSDPSVLWSDYLSPARRTLAVGLAGDCDDFAVIMASCIGAVGGKVRIVHGYDGPYGHAWAEVYLGEGQQGQRVVNSLKGLVKRSPIAITKTPAQQSWLVLDWRLGEYSMKTAQITIAWTGN